MSCACKNVKLDMRFSLDRKKKIRLFLKWIKG